MAHGPHYAVGRNGKALTVDLKLHVVIWEPWPMAPTQEDSLIVGSDLTQGQSSP